jgi:hypothetical protein
LHFNFIVRTNHQQINIAVHETERREGSDRPPMVLPFAVRGLALLDAVQNYNRRSAARSRRRFTAKARVVIGRLRRQPTAPQQPAIRHSRNRPCGSAAQRGGEANAAVAATRLKSI